MIRQGYALHSREEGSKVFGATCGTVIINAERFAQGHIHHTSDDFFAGESKVKIQGSM